MSASVSLLLAKSRSVLREMMRVCPSIDVIIQFISSALSKYDIYLLVPEHLT